MTNIEKLENELINTGLSKNEARVYLYLLEQSKAVGVSKIAEATGIHRQYVYIIIENLIKTGLVEKIISGARQNYLALSPDRLITISRQKVMETENLAKELNAISKLGHEQESEILFGTKALIEHEYEFENKASRGEKQYIIGGNLDAFIKCMGDEYREVTLLDEKKRIETFYLGSDKDKGNDKISEYREHRFHKKYMKKLPEGLTHTVIRKDRVCFFSFLNPPTVHIIKSKTVADNYRNFFMMLWGMV